MVVHLKDRAVRIGEHALDLAVVRGDAKVAYECGGVRVRLSRRRFEDTNAADFVVENHTTTVPVEASIATVRPWNRAVRNLAWIVERSSV